MKKSTLLGGLLALTFAAVASAAPLFPETSDEHWAATAMQKLRAAGLIEGYPQGGLRGDRLTTRWEVAMIIARLLESQKVDFADKKELEALRDVTAGVKDELDQLGVRVTNLEEQVAKLDTRVKDREKLRWHGSIEARIVGQTFYNRGNLDNDAGRNGTGTKNGVPFINYDQAIGANAAPSWRSQNQGVIPVVDYRNGRPLTSGVGFTTTARLGLDYDIDQNNVAGVEFASYTAQGNTIVDSYWGVQAPYGSSTWTNNVADGPGGVGSPFSRVTFDHAYYLNKATNTRLTLGAFEPLRMDSFVYAGQPNATAFGSARYPGFGVQLQGNWDTGKDQQLRYELFVSRFGEANVYAGLNYQHTVLGGDVAYQWGRADLKFNYARYYDENPNGGSNYVGLFTGTNVAYGNSSGYTPLQWVNPAGYLAANYPKLTNPITGGAFVANFTDPRPIPGWNTTSDDAAGVRTGGGNYGPQQQTTYGSSGHYWVPFGKAESKDGLRFTGEFGHSVYTPNGNSSYFTTGEMYRGEGALFLDDANLELRFQAIRVDPNYNPAVFPNAQLGLRFVRSFNFTGRFSIYDNNNYPQNRQGFYTRGAYTFDEKATGVSWKVGILDQTQTSLYDVRLPANSLGAGYPNGAVLGFAPGFFDPVFSGFATPLQFGSQSKNSFDAALNPLENPRGHANEYAINLFHQFKDPGVRLDAAFERNTFRRDSALSAAQGGSQNQVDLTIDYALFGAKWDFAPNWALRGGGEIVHARGHHDPAGLYNGFAMATGQTNFRNIDSLQTIPYLGLDWQMTKQSTASIDLRYYSTKDFADMSAGAGAGSIGETSNPFNFSGPQISGYYKLTF